MSVFTQLSKTLKAINSAFTLKEENIIIMFFLLKKHDYHDFFLERESTVEARALQREALFSENAFLHRDCETEMGKVFTQINAIPKRIKIAIRDWRQMKVLSKSFQMT